MNQYCLNQGVGYDATLKGKGYSDCFWEGSANEDGQWLKIQNGLKKMV
jgi:hypothetical protein